jgi:hypothetical protein
MAEESPPKAVKGAWSLNALCHCFLLLTPAVVCGDAGFFNLTQMMTLLSSDCCLSWGLDCVWGGRAGILKKNTPVDLATASNFGSTDNLLGGKLSRLKQHSAVTHHHCLAKIPFSGTVRVEPNCFARVRISAWPAGAHLRSLSPSH